MKVLFLYRGKDVAGSNRVVVTQGRSLEEAGVEVEYFPLSGGGPVTWIRAVRLIREQLKEGGADLVHAHYGMSAIAGLLAASRKPLVVSFMGSDILGSHTPGGGLKLWSRMMSMLNILLARWCYSLSIVKSAGMDDRLIRHTPSAVIPNGVDPDVFKPVDRLEARKRLNLDPDEYLVLFPAGRNNPEKNFTLASASVGRLVEKGFRLLETDTAGREEMSLLFNAADLLLVASFHEGSPNVVKEAMACCCPVVATPVGDIPWLFGSIPGHFLSGFDSREMAEATEAAARYRRESLFTGGRERILQLGLDSGSIAAVIKDHYSRLTSKED